MFLHHYENHYEELKATLLDLAESPEPRVLVGGQQLIAQVDSTNRDSDSNVK
jgi:hypothetical protein